MFTQREERRPTVFYRMLLQQVNQRMKRPPPIGQRPWTIGPLFPCLAAPGLIVPVPSYNKAMVSF